MKQLLKIGAICLMCILMTGCSTKNNGENPLSEGITQTPSNDYESVGQEEEEIIENTKEVIIALDPGHGGTYSGASYDGREEKNLTLTVATYIKEYLEENYTGMQICMIREDDSVFSEDVKEDLEMRAQYAQDLNADVFVSLHFNASDNHESKGSMVFVSKQETVNETSVSLAESILKELEGLGLNNQGVKTRDSNDMFDDNGIALDYYAINRHCAIRGIPGIIVEHCFMDNSYDQSFIDSEEDLRALAKADAVGIAEFYELIEK